VDIRQGVDPALLERERCVQEQLGAKSEELMRLLSGQHTEDQARTVRKDMDALLGEYQNIEALIRANSPRYAALTQPQPLSLKEIQQRVLDDDTLLLEYSLGEERSYLWAVTTDAVTAYELPSRAEVEKLARRVYDLLTARNRQVNFETAAERRARIASADEEYSAKAEELSNLILAPAAAQMNKKRLLVVGDGTLQYLPFAALPAPALGARRQSSTHYAPLIANYEVVNLPSASTLAVLRKELAGRKPAPKAIAVLADPVFGKDDERLKRGGAIARSGRSAPAKSEAQTASFSERPLTRSARDLGVEGEELYLPRLFFTRREAEAIVRFVPQRQFKKAIDFAASKATATDPELGQYRYVHFATHTLLNSSNPSLSGIVLSLVNPEGDEQEGFLLAQEIYNLKLPAELVVLSSCKTGLGKEVRGEGVIGITRGFMYAGAARVTMSLWDVDDEATAEMMKRFYRAMLIKPHSSPAAALRSAQVSMWRSQPWRAPYYWAAFVLQGEYK
jgi:CHAT domain-containing protein